MQPRTLAQILGELDSTYNPQIDSLRQRQALIPGQIAEEEKGLGAKQEQAFGDILGGARRRGLGFSGIPLGEQAKYTATEYLPALARLRQSGREQAMSLEDAILGIQERRNNFGQQIYQQEQDRAEQARQFNAQQRAASTGLNGLFGGSVSAPQVQGASKTSGTQMVKRSDGGFNFTNEYGNPISAAQFAAAKGVPFRDLLQLMARQGDQGAQTLLGFVGNDFGYDPSRIGNNGNLYNAFVWGSGRSYQAPQANTRAGTMRGIGGPRR